MEKKYTPILTVCIVIALLFAVLVFARLKRTPLATPDTYNEVSPSADLAMDFNNHRHYMFIQDGCSHCEAVEEYLDNIEGSRALLDLEEPNFSVAATSQYFITKAQEFDELCGLNSAGIGTPFLYINDESVPLADRCVTGDTPIIAYFDSILNADTAPAETLDVVDVESVSLD